MTDSKEQCICRRLNFKIGKTAMESPGNVNNLSSDRKLDRAQSFKWFV
jgi:hypothetical protein